MEKFVLSEDMLTDIEEIDDQHRKLLSWGNILYTDDTEQAVKKVEATLHNLSRYVSYHFQAEENAMIRHDYEMTEKHQKQHERLMIEVGMLVRRLNKEGATKGLLVELQYQLIDWFSHHIKEWDQPFAIFLKMHKFSDSFTLEQKESELDWTELDLI